MGDEYPSAGYALLLAGGILEIIVGIPLALLYGAVVITSYTVSDNMGQAATHSALSPLGWVLFSVCFLWILIWGILMILSARWVKTGDEARVHKGGVLGLISSIFGLNILGFIGAILALAWKKKKFPPAPKPPV